MLDRTKFQSLKLKVQALEKISKERENSKLQQRENFQENQNIPQPKKQEPQVGSARKQKRQTPKKIMKEEIPEVKSEDFFRELREKVQARAKRLNLKSEAIEPVEESQNEEALPKKPACSVFSPKKRRPATPVKFIPLNNNNLVFNTDTQKIEQDPTNQEGSLSFVPKGAELPQEQNKSVEHLEKKVTAGEKSQVSKNSKTIAPKIKAPKATQSYSYLIWSGFVTALGVAAVALAFTVLNAATGGTAGLAALGIGLATLLAGAGLFAQGYRTRAKVEPQIEPGVEMAGARV